MASTSRPIALDDQQLEIVKAAAQHISPDGRGEFLQSIADALAGGECACGANRACKRDQMDPNLMTGRLIAELIVIVMTAALIGTGALGLGAFVAERMI